MASEAALSSGLIPAAAARAACAHCGLDVPSGLIEPGEPAQFCCNGCRAAYAVIHACGLDRYYRLLNESNGRSRQPVVRTDRRYGGFDDSAFHRLYVRPVERRDGRRPDGATGSGLLWTELYVENVHCAACLWLLERLPRIVPGVVESRVDFRRRAVRLTWDPAVVSLSRCAATLDSLGYPPTPARQAATRERRREEDRRYLVRLGIAGACAGNVMLLAMALYSGLFDSLEPSYARIFTYLSLGFTLVSLAWPGAVFFRGAAAALRTRTLHLDLPIAVGLGVGALWSTYITLAAPMGWEGAKIAGAGGIYFDSLAMLVFALLIGRFIQHRQQRWAADSVELLFSLSPATARLVDGQEVREVATESLQPGQVVEVLAGECIPVDGTLVSGESQVDQAILTGESVPVDALPGARVAAGYTNLSATIRIRVEAAGADTRIGRLMRLVEECSRRRAPIVQFADRLSGWFVAVMMAVALATMLGWWLVPAESGGGLPVGVRNAIAVLIVACPCGLGLATPLAMTVALGRAARAGLLIKGGDVIQALARPGIMLLDKTGTLTQGRMAVVEWHGPEQLKAPLAAIERSSTHPVARALAALAEPDSDAPATDRVQSTQGGGVTAWVDGRRMSAGSLGFLASRGIAVDQRWRSIAGDGASRGLTPVLVAVDDRCEAVALLGDPIRPDAGASIARLRTDGWELQVISGDHPATATALGRAIGLGEEAVRGGVTPEQKLAIVESLRRRGDQRPVVMVGDGVNDAAALAAATVGIAVHGGAEASLTAADVVVTRPGLTPLVELVAGSARTVRALRVNLGVSLGYNVLAVGVCVTGLVTPLMAAVLMLSSSLTVVGLSLRAWGGGRGDGHRAER